MTAMTGAQRTAKWKRANPAKVSAQRERWRETHHDQNLAQRQDYFKRQYENDPDRRAYYTAARAHRKGLLNDLSAISPAISEQVKKTLAR